jgi:acetolactate synthase-1/2/3 large subunit
MNIQWADIDKNDLRGFTPENRISKYSDLLAAAKKLILKSEKPLILCGGGVRKANAAEELQSFSDKSGIPVITSWAGRDCMPVTHSCYCGVIGQFGLPSANFLTKEADLIIALGSRFTIRQIGNPAEKFAPEAKIISINIDKGELDDGRVDADVKIEMDIKNFLTGFNQNDYRQFKQNVKNLWRQYAKSVFIRNSTPWNKTLNSNFVNPYEFIHSLSKWLTDDAIVTADTGQSLIVAAQALKITKKQRFFSSFAHSPMGYSVAAAIGAQIANPLKQVVAIIGDGGLSVNLQELQTIAFYNLPVKIMLFNNQCYGLIKEFQDPNLNGHYAATVKEYGYAPPDYEKIAKAFDIRFISVKNDNELSKVNDAFKEGPVICELNTDPDFRVLGIVPGQNGLHEIDKKFKIESYKQWIKALH